MSINMTWQRISFFVLAGLTGTVLLTSITYAQDTSTTLARNFRPDPVKLEGTGGGGVSLADLAGVAEHCRGFGDRQPNHTIVLTDNFPLFDLLVYTNNINDDPTMLLKGDNGIVACNEPQGRNPQISQRLPKGTYQIWVGSKTANQRFNYTLSLSEIRQK
jgi:hypothetical protein